MDTNPIHPGEHLAEILDELGISASRLARAIDVPPRRINDIVRGRRVAHEREAAGLSLFFGHRPFSGACM